MNREEKKVGRRAKQAQAVAKKADAEEQYFRECQQQARRSGAQLSAKGEAELFQKQGAAGINFDTYDKIEVQISGTHSGAAPALAHFNDLGAPLPGFLARNVGLMNYTRPTPIQKHAVPLALVGCDLMCCAQTGSGKTFAFLLPVCSALGTGDRRSSAAPGAAQAAPQCVVMAPTRELASQINLEAEKLTNRSGLRAVVVYGGADQKKQIRELAYGCDIIVATPGRLTDFLERGIVTLVNVRYLVLDEADRMLGAMCCLYPSLVQLLTHWSCCRCIVADMGFEPQIRRIVQQADMPPKEQRQTMLFSATFAPEIQKLAKAFLRDYVWIAVGRVGSTVENITQRLVRATADKRHKLR